MVFSGVLRSHVHKSIHVVLGPVFVYRLRIFVSFIELFISLTLLDIQTPEHIFVQ